MQYTTITRMSNCINFNFSFTICKPASFCGGPDPKQITKATVTDYIHDVFKFVVQFCGVCKLLLIICHRKGTNIYIIYAYL